MNDIDDGTHECPYPECEARLPHHLLACRPHWKVVPGDIKYRVNDAFRHSRANYLEAREDAVAAMERHHANARGRDRRR